MNPNTSTNASDKPITEPVAYHQPLHALLEGREVKILAHGNQEGKSPVFQCVDTQTGRTAWESQSKFQIIDTAILPVQSIRQILSQR